MQLREFVGRHKVLAAYFGGVIWLGTIGYVIPAFDTGSWNPRKQWENTNAFTEYLNTRDNIADIDNNGFLSPVEVDYVNAFDRKSGLEHVSTSSTQDLQRAIKIYQDELKKRDKQKSSS